MNDAAPAPPDALLLMSSHCPHCPTVLKGLGELVKAGVIGRLEVINMESRPDLARHYGVRTVPWIRLGEFELQGLHSEAELRHWAEVAGTETGMAGYFADLLKQGRLAQVSGHVKKHPGHIRALLLLARDPDTELTIRIGVSAVLEELEGSAELQQHLPALLDLAAHDDPRVRADASHFLALTRSADVIETLRAMTGDAERAVRDTAADSLEELREHLES